MTIFSGERCPVTSCPANKGERGLTCDWLRNGRGRCHHPAYRELWQTLTEEAQALAAEAAPLGTVPAPVIPTLSGYDHNPIGPARSLASRATAANVPVSPERARQMLLDLGEV